MKKLFVPLLVSLSLLLIACGEKKEQELITEEINNNLETQLIAYDIDENMARQFLNGEITVDNFDDKENLAVSDIGYFGTPSEYTLVDLDEDGARELVIVFDPSGDRIIIDVANDTSTAYYLPIRWYNDIKKDGTAGWSASAFEHGARKISFADGEAVFEDFIVYNTNDGIFKVDGKEVSEEECNIAISHQHEKESVEWTEIESN